MPKNIKLELSIRFYLRSSLKLRITHMSNAFFSAGVDKKLCNGPDGFDVSNGFVFSYRRSGLILPAYKRFDEMITSDNSDLFAFYSFDNDDDRYLSMRRLYKSMRILSQSLIFNYDNQGHVNVKDDKWILL